MILDWMVHISGRQNVGKVGDYNDQMTHWIAVISVHREIHTSTYFIFSPSSAFWYNLTAFVRPPKKESLGSRHSSKSNTSTNADGSGLFSIRV